MNVEVYQAVLNLRGNPDFAVFMRHVEGLEASWTKKLVSASKDDTQLCQGYVRAYEVVTKLVKDAPTAIARANTP